MTASLRSVCVFCGSSIGARPAYADAARALAAELARRRMTLVYGGGSVGLMGVVADGVLAAGGSVTGVIPRALATKELLHTGLTETHVVASMHERKALMAELSDGFVALPGGLGTFEELLEILTWSQLGIHQKPVGVLNVDGYWETFAAFLDHAVAEGFVSEANRALLIVAATPAALLDALAAWCPPSSERLWLRLDQT
jgi:uncharacterized protein (TIGR00730 family)